MGNLDDLVCSKVTDMGSVIVTTQVPLPLHPSPRQGEIVSMQAFVVMVLGMDGVVTPFGIVLSLEETQDLGFTILFARNLLSLRRHNQI